MNSNLPIQKKPWDQWPDETDTAYDRFATYLEMGSDRSLDKVRQKYGKSTSYKRQLAKWSARYDWVSRSREYDKHIIKQSLKNQEELLDHARGRLLEKVDKALDVVFDIMAMDDYTFSKDKSSNAAQKLKAAQWVLETAGLVAPDSQVDPGKNTDDATYIQNIYNHIENKYPNRNKDGD